MSNEPLLLHYNFDKENGGDVKIKNSADAKRWIESQFSVWNWLGQFQNSMQDGNVQGTLQNFYHTFFLPLNAMHHNILAGNEPDFDAMRRLLTEVLNHQFFHGNAHRAKIIKKIYDQNGITAAAAALCIALKLPFSPNSSSSIIGIMNYATIIGNINSESATIVNEEMTSVKETAKSDFKKIENDAEAKIKELEKLTNAGSDQFDMIQKRLRTIAKAAKRLSDKRSKQQDDKLVEKIKMLDDTQKTYTEFMGLSAPSQYWNEKSKAHKKKTKTHRNILLIYVGVVLILYAVGIWAFWQHIIDYKENAYVPVVLFVFITTIVFWAGRILVRLYLSELHLTTDAEERSVMAKTYLALVKDGNLDAATDRQLVLAPLFRPTSDGIIKDDGAPTFTPAALLSRGLANH